MVAHDANRSMVTMASTPRLHVVNQRRRGGWGGYGVVHSTLSAFGWIQQQWDPAWVVLLSGQDYPATSPAAVREVLLASEADAHITVEQEVPLVPSTPEELWWHARYFYRWRTLPRVPVSLPASLARKRANLQYRLSISQRLVFLWTLPRDLGTALGVRRADPPFDSSYRCWAASQWMAVSRRALHALFADIARRPQLVRTYQQSILPDESLIQTVLMNSRDVSIEEPNLTYQRWSGSGNAHAADLGIDDFEQIVRSGRPFARKMHSTVSVELMDALDAHTGLVPA
jgi:hypothetical protein